MSYLEGLLKKYAVPVTVENTFRALRDELEKGLSNCWKLPNPRFYYGGSYAKRTMIGGGYDLDLVVYFAPADQFTVRQIYEGVETRLQSLKYRTFRHNVAIRLPYEGFHVDVVPGRALDNTFRYANLYASEGNTTKQTSLKAHIDLTRDGSSQDVVKVLKLWKRQHNLPLRSFILELATVSGLYGNRDQSLEGRVWKVLGWLAQHFATARLIDPANTNNVVSDDVSALDKQVVQHAAAFARTQRQWTPIVS
jgi:hypothetical protein